MVWAWLMLLLLASPVWGQGRVVALNHAHPLARGLVLWHLGLPGLTGSRLHFDLARRHHGLLEPAGAATWAPVTDLPGIQAGVWNGTSTYVGVPRQPALEPAAVTWAAWVWAASTQVSFATILDKSWQNNAGPYFSSYSMYLDHFDVGDRTRVACNVANDDFPVASAPAGTLPAQTWTWMACSYQATRAAPQLRQWRNGVLTASAISTLPIVMDATATGDLAVGAAGRNPNNLFQGQIAGAMVYNRALDDAEVRQLYALARQQYRGLLVPPPPSGFLAPFLGQFFPFFQTER